MKKRIILVTFLVSTLLASCTLADKTTPEGQANPTVMPTVVEVVAETHPDPTGQDLASQPTPAPSITPVPPVPTEVPADIPAGPVAPLAGLIYQASGALWRIEADGKATQITVQGGTVSPDGKQLLLERDGDLWLLDIESGTESNLTNTADQIESGGRWGSAGSNLIVFGSKETSEEGPSTGHLSLLATDGSGAQVLETENSSNAYPALSPDGRTIAYDLGGSGWLHHIRSGSREQLDLAAYGLSDAGQTKIGSPAWSPDGRMLAWMIGGGFGPAGDWQIAVGLMDMSAKTFQLLHPYTVLGGSGGWVPAPVWSPDGQWLAVTTMGEIHRADLWAVNVSSQEEYYLGWASSPVWSPDAHSLIFGRMPCETVPCYEDTQLMQVKVGEWEPQAIDVPAASVPLAWVSNFKASSGAGSTLACPAESGPEVLACDIQNALLARDMVVLSDLMADPFAIGYWRSEGLSLTAEEAAAELDQSRLPADTSSLTFTTDRAQFPPLMSMPLEGMFGPDVEVVGVVYSEGWGVDGLGAALIYITEPTDGAYAWHGIVLSSEKFDKAQTAEPAPTENTDNTWQISLANEEWVAEAKAVFPTSGSDYYYELVVSKLDNSLSWTLVQAEELWAMGYILPVPIHFSKDGSQLFFVHQSTADGCGLFASGSNLQQVELATGQFSEINGTAGISQAISPDDSTLALVRRTTDTTALILLDLLSGVEREVPLSVGEPTESGRIVWSPDGSSLVLTLAHEPCSSNWTHSIVQVDIPSLTITTLVEKDERHFWSTEWVENKIRLEDVQGNRWWLALESGEIIDD